MVTSTYGVSGLDSLDGGMVAKLLAVGSLAGRSEVNVRFQHQIVLRRVREDSSKVVVQKVHRKAMTNE